MFDSVNYYRLIIIIEALCLNHKLIYVNLRFQ